MSLINNTRLSFSYRQPTLGRRATSTQHDSNHLRCSLLLLLQFDCCLFSSYVLLPPPKLCAVPMSRRLLSAPGRAGRICGVDLAAAHARPTAPNCQRPTRRLKSSRTHTIQLGGALAVLVLVSTRALQLEFNRRRHCYCWWRWRRSRHRRRRRRRQQRPRPRSFHTRLPIRCRAWPVLSCAVPSRSVGTTMTIILAHSA